MPIARPDPALTARLGRALGLLLLALASLPASGAHGRAAPGLQRAPTSQAEPRFFFAGNGRLEMRHGHFNERLDVRYRRSDGSYDPLALERIAYFFRSRGDGAVAPISLRLIELLSYLQAVLGVREMILLSGYRSPEFNEALGAQGRAAAFASLHTQTLAADLALPGQNLRRLWLKLRETEIGGVGYYPSQRFLHIDVGPPRFWEESTSRVSERLSAGNARVFLRTDFDRYTQWDGAEIVLHSVTAFPLRLQKYARFEHAGGLGVQLPMVPAVPTLASDQDGCWVIEQAAPHLRFRVVASEETAVRLRGARPQRGKIVWETCAPRVERTPEEVRSNTVEWVP